MKARRRTKLTRAGWKVGGADEFLGLSKEESCLVEMKLDLAARLKELRASRNMSQAEVARLLGSSQSRVAKMEAADGTVTLDLLVRALLTIGLSKAEIARAIGGKASRRAA
jgi:predicted XRE-type DNA-binding protein